jgi:uncharacterized protein YijF (DUF1287 family)
MRASAWLAASLSLFSLHDVQAQVSPTPAPVIRDVGIFSDLDDTVEVTLPSRLDVEKVRVVWDETHAVAVLWESDIPRKAYAVASAPRPVPVSFEMLLSWLRAADAAELRRHAGRPAFAHIAPPKGPTPADWDGDGIPNALDLLMGARKLVANRALYTEGYHTLAFPGGDVPRTVGVCSDTIVRACRNAGLDLQRSVAADIQASPASYRNVDRPNASIDHRRVKNLLVWFRRHVPEIAQNEPLIPGDVVFLDTFPAKPGPDHVGIVSDRQAPSGYPFIINNWTVGYREGEMDLLPSVPVTHRFRVK